MQIRTKITLYFFITAASLMTISFSVIYYVTKNKITSDFQEQILKKAKTRAVYRIKLHAIDNSTLRTLDLHKKDVLQHENISIYDSNNIKIYTNNNLYDFKTILIDFPSILKQIKNGNNYFSSINNLEIVSELFKDKNQKYVILVAAKNTYGLALLKNLQYNLAIIFFVILSVLWIFGWIFSKKILFPISIIMNQVDRIKLNNISLRLPKKDNKDELSRLTETFNNMLDRLEKSFLIQKSFLANVSHELMNPLSMIRTQIEISQLSSRNSESYKKTLDSIYEDITRLIGISEQLISLSKMSTTSDKNNFVTLRIDEILFETKQKFKQKNPEAIIKLIIYNLPDNEKSLTILGNDILIQSCFYNLIENGIKYSSNNTIIIQLDVRDSNIYISFKNDGEIISPENHEKIFIPFFRSTINTEKKGFGIGLSIVKNILEIHNAKIHLKSGSINYTEFIVEFSHH